jgi:pimeloyl-ACP methyl ester carboxylesterase
VEIAEHWIVSRETSLRLRTYAGAGAGGPSVVALHGLGTATDVLREAVPGLDPYGRLAAAGFNVVALDWPGHGRSGGPRGTMTYRAAMDAAGEAVDFAEQQWGGTVGLVGTALGGVLAFYAALEDEQVAAVVCHNVLDLRDVRPVLQRTRQGVLLPLAGRVRSRTALTQRLRVPTGAVAAPTDMAADPHLARRLRTHPQAVRSYELASLVSLFLTPEDKPGLTAQTTPTMVAVGSADRVLPVTPARAFVSHLPGESQMWVLPGGSHQLWLEHPDAFVPAAAEFLHKHLT